MHVCVCMCLHNEMKIKLCRELLWKQWKFALLEAAKNNNENKQKNGKKSKKKTKTTTIAKT